MFKEHPKGLFALALANTGERFGYYTMLAIFTLFLQAKFGFDTSQTSSYFSWFLGAVYLTPLLGGFLADKWLGYGRTIMIGIIIMFAGYLLLAIPNNDRTFSLIAMVSALALISLGTGLFKGNLQVLVGNLYDDPKYSSKRDLAFSLFYMCINIGAFFAPSAAEWITNYSLSQYHMVYDAHIPALAHQLLNGTISTDGLAQLTTLAAEQGTKLPLADFSSLYIEKLSAAYNYGFGIACISLVISIAIFVVFKKTYKHADYNANKPTATSHVEELTPKQTRERIFALLMVFAVVVFFWMSFHQNGLTMTFFARDYTTGSVSGLDRIGFSLVTMVLLIAAVYSITNIFQSKTGKGKAISGLFLAASLGAIALVYAHMEPSIKITPQIFQQFNPFFVIVLTPLFVGLFSWLAKKKKEPSAPRKISFGMVIAAAGFALLAFGSIGLLSPSDLKASGGVSPTLVSPDWLIGTYLVLTFAELFLSPMGISFVSRVAPPKYKGLMMGGWFGATALGNKLTGVIGDLWGSMELWMVWGVLVLCCLVSAIFMFAMLKKLETITK
ncbi:peptide MFS transporter [Paludibacter sp.]|uniref:peptide MFS transporter n=1 Tax=Paludibacter sp. TaxID=1898105 RepID=UPI0013551D15|nr:peptide MFS transporter [Paludibacter sp.]MTK54070.1 peptide MFS transporter [Paludibacter sp.]